MHKTNLPYIQTNKTLVEVEVILVVVFIQVLQLADKCGV
jgi:hypothetical protein